MTLFDEVVSLGRRRGVESYKSVFLLSYVCVVSTPVSFYGGETSRVVSRPGPFDFLDDPERRPSCFLPFVGEFLLLVRFVVSCHYASMVSFACDRAEEMMSLPSSVIMRPL